MKNYCLLIVGLFFAIFLQAQIKQNAVLLGGRLGQNNNLLRSVNSEEKKSTLIIQSAIGKAVKENKVVGVLLGFSFDNNRNINTGLDTSTRKVNVVNIGIFYRQYKKIGKDFYLFGEVETGYRSVRSNNKLSSIIGDVRISENAWFTNFNLGAAYQLSKKIQLELIMPNIGIMEYGITKRTSTVASVSDYKNKGFSFDSNISSNTFLSNLQIGFRFVL
jgi:tetrahydromethanopterin S-methyltransferase subunit G